jgi:hypothetical protein
MVAVWRHRYWISLVFVLLGVAYGHLLGTVEAMRNVLTFQGMVLAVGCFFYLAVKRHLQGSTTREWRTRLDTSLGIAMGGLAVTFLVAGWTGGTASYIERNNSEALGWALLAVRSLTLCWQLLALHCSVWVWRTSK